jgi:hypothetical protein
VQTKDDGTHVILPVAAHLAVSDHARLPVMMPRQSDGKMRRDGSSAARPQPSQPVAERGGLHGASDLSSPVARAIAATRTRALTGQEERRRWRRTAESSHRLGLQDKAGGPAAVAALLDLCLHVVFCAARDGAPNWGCGPCATFSLVFSAPSAVAARGRHPLPALAQVFPRWSTTPAFCHLWAIARLPIVVSWNTTMMTSASARVRSAIGAAWHLAGVVPVACAPARSASQGRRGRPFGGRAATSIG